MNDALALYASSPPRAPACCQQKFHHLRILVGASHHIHSSGLHPLPCGPDPCPVQTLLYQVPIALGPGWGTGWGLELKGQHILERGGRARMGKGPARN